MKYNIPEALSEEWATEITMCTLVYHGGGKFPKPTGNCFSVSTGKKEYRIVNFGLENLEELIKRGNISYPIKIFSITDRHAVIADERIPDKWYQEDFCTVCCPDALLPLPQRLKNRRAVDAKWKEYFKSFCSIDLGKRDAFFKGLGYKEDDYR